MTVTAAHPDGFCFVFLKDRNRINMQKSFRCFFGRCIQNLKRKNSHQTEKRNNKLIKILFPAKLVKHFNYKVVYFALCFQTK